MSVTLTIFEKKHLEGLKQWGYHKDPRFNNYDFKYFTSEQDYKRWFKRKQRFFSKRLFAILDDDTLVGFLTMKNIQWCVKRAELGIVIDPNKLEMGYGSKAISLFLNLFFTQYNFNQLSLQVADFNRRAMRVYQKNGFKIKQSEEQPYEVQTDPFAIVLIGEGAFKMQGDKVVTLIHTMVVDRHDYISKN